MPKEETAINARPKRPRRFERVVWLWQRWVVWPLQDRRDLPGGPSRAVVGWGATLLVAAAGASALALTASSDTGEGAPTAIAVSAEPAPRPVVVPEAEPTGETLQGATPVFTPKPAEDPAHVDSAKAIESSPPPVDPSASASTARISSEPSSSSPSPAAEAAAASVEAVDGPPAGPKAISVAREFADAFVVFETGGEKSEVRKAFAATATTELSRSLLRRPPRLPADVEVPRAKVVNVVAGPSHGGVFTISVSLLRVGITSELRLDMEKLKADGWRVTNVLG